jgi:hypothetical protein
MLPAPLAPIEVDVGSPTSTSNSSFKKPVLKKVHDLPPPPGLMPSTVPKIVVTFCKRVRVKKIRSYKHFSKEERDATWISPEEYVNIKQLCIHTLKLMHKNPVFSDCDEYSSRGLEVRTRAAALARKENKAFAASAVLDEQDSQDESGVKDPERIRESCQKICRASERVAQFMGSKDFEAIQEYISDRQSR